MKKKLLSLSLVVMLILSSFSFAFAEDVAPETKTITIVHTNDTHARVLDSDGGFGFAKIATLIKEQKALNPNTLVVDAGDTLHGLPIINISKGEGAVKVLNAVGYDFMVPGNHDFNYGYERLLELKDMAEFEMLSANIYDSNNKNLFDPYKIVEIDGVKVGIFGLTTTETTFKTSPNNVKGITFANEIETAKKIVEELQDKTDIIIAITHVGLDKSTEITSDKIAEQVDGIDVIIDGHSHTALKDGKLVNNTLIAQTGEYDKNLGIVNIEISNGKIVNKEAKLLCSKEMTDVEADADVQAVLDSISSENEEFFSEVVAKTDIELDGARENVRTKETNLGNLSADAVRNETKADIAFVNGGNIRISIPVGDITQGDLAKLFPFGNRMQVVELTGSEIIQALELSVAGYPATKGGFLQVSGLTFKFAENLEPGNRVQEVTINGELIDTAEELAKTYTVALNDYLAIGGDGYEVFNGKLVIAEFGSYEEIIARYLNVNGTKGCEVSGRIEVVTKEVELVVTEPEKTEDITYIVVSGDCLWRIAQKYNTTWQILAEYNKLKNPNLIFPNQIIVIPSK
ncbi:5'-nucleotidase C-terminal domain-containing protein [Sedimentibacter sp. zth1]|uniref:5'-nucleotidase C-terminal domain-containing protein n=1 Tax=Sedimentibacter sp. zth1 TaxID=2816908 RepID=UPI001A9373CF|nr:5'-nucleotidase C-terminal domain-containing protein [Sedimentibacter sp. zth1]QSX07077.1 5'-nucleotidase C-terminal domain-containing protein [Sedimentibacter sp. zth1]